MQQLLVQKILVGGAELDIALLQSCTYVETLDLSGPRLMLTIQDRDNIVRDDFGVVEGASLTVSFSDQHLRGGLDVSEEFVIRSVVVAQNISLTVSAFPKPIHKLKTPSEEALFLNDTDVPGVIGKVLPGIPLESDQLPAVDMWHLLSGERPSKKLRGLAYESAAAFYYLRKKFYTKSYAKLWAQPSFAEFHYDDARKTNQIVSYTGLYRKDLANERMNRSFVGWDMVKGVLGQGGGGPVEISRHSQEHKLAAMNTYMLPAIDFGTHGWGSLKPGVCIDLKFHRSQEGKPFDESLPEKVLLTAVAHHYATNRYSCRVKGGVLHA